MAQMFKIIIPESMSPEESYAILESFDALGYETFDHLALEMKRDYFEAFWEYTSEPPLPNLPENVQIKEMYT